MVSILRFSFYMCIKATVKVGKAAQLAKPLKVIWERYPQFSAKNSIIVDDLKRNFLLNPQSGIEIKKFSNEKTSTSKDKELRLLAKYLDKIADFDDFTKLNHLVWRYMV